MTTITVIDESMLGAKQRWDLELLDETLSVRELIKRRIYQEVTEYNAKQQSIAQALVQPTNIECMLNDFQAKTLQPLKWEEHYEQAIELFTHRRFILLVDAKQMRDLDATITLHIHSEVTFLKLVPLIGDSHDASCR